MTDKSDTQAILDWIHASKKDQEPYACCCMGPQNGEPLCPCRMRSVKVIGGRYVQMIDLGEAPQ